MDLLLSQEQEDLRASVRKFFQDQVPMSRVRAVVDGADYDGDLWKRMTGELGLAGLAVPESYGGAGAGHVERSIVLEEMGRALLPSSFFSSAVLAADTLLALDDEDARAGLLPRIASGDLLATVAVAEKTARWDSTVDTKATESGDGWVLDGRKNLVIDGQTAAAIIVYADSGFFLVDGDASGLTRTPLVSLDPTRRIARLDFAATPAKKLASADPAAVLAKIADLAAVALAAEQVGGLARTMEMTVDYAKIRVQFGRLIGSYQAVKHGCVDSYVDWELTSSVLRYAAWVADNQPDELPTAAALVRASVSPAYFQVAARTIQLHGGIGYTWEHDAHLYYKRAKSAEQLFGTVLDQRETLADRLGI
ncbi:acyl-CoA dehydrogenase family protein [Fodinicola acaciae]|uniref:acyl-CoA dehydrogenase family protein n=1 Tax=Fodinicola acaciae TaxID=2681555 RepID=UPI0013D8A453|nr:acyl-CoA dehydrogenase family protein [Fodinicola acaciae]